VYIETLVIRDSFEEAILNRRSELEKEEPSMELLRESGQGSIGRSHIKSKPSRKGTSMADDGKFQELIRHINFMPVSCNQDRPYPLLSDYVLDECEVMKDFKVPFSRNTFPEIQQDSMEPEHYNESNVGLPLIKFEDDPRLAQDKIMAYEGDVDLDSTMEESKMVVDEWFEIMDGKVDCEEDEKALLSEYGFIKQELGVKKEQKLELTTRKTESRLSRFPLELVKRETSHEEVSNSKRVRFG